MKDSGAKKSRVIRNETPMGRVVYLRPETQKSAPTLWSWSSAFHGRPLAFILIAILAISSLALTVSGSSFDYYPDNCLGSWRGPENAQGKPNIKVNLASPRSFTQENSAVFFGGTQSIICQSFSGQSIPDDTTLESLTLSLSLSVKHPAISDVPAEVAPEESGGDSAQTGTKPGYTVLTG